MSSLGTYNFLGDPWLRTHPICNFAHVPKLCSHKALLSITGLPRLERNRLLAECIFGVFLHFLCIYGVNELQVNVPSLLGWSSKLHGYGQLLASKRSLHPYLKSVGGLSS